MSDEGEQTYHYGRRTDRTYTSAPFAGGKLRYVTRVIDSPEACHFARVAGELVIRRTEAQRKEIKAVVTVDEREIKTLTIQRFSKEGDPNQKLHFSFIGDEIDVLVEYLLSIKSIPLESKRRYLSDEEVRQLVLSAAQKVRLLADDPELIAQLVEGMACPQRRYHLES